MQHNMAFMKLKILSPFEERKSGSLFVADAIDTSNRILKVHSTPELKEKMHNDGFFAIMNYKANSNGDDNRLTLHKGSKVWKFALYLSTQRYYKHL
jgi:hypothetical protein